MCDYSLEDVASRPAEVGDKLETGPIRMTSGHMSSTRGFHAPGDYGTAVCLKPGTEIAFESDVECAQSPYMVYGGDVGDAARTIVARTARFRQVNQGERNRHHDAVEFPDGQVIELNRLVPGQKARVLQLPAEPGPKESLTQMGERMIAKAAALLEPERAL